MSATLGPRLLILETSGRQGQVAVACGKTLLHARPLDEARRHARDLAPAVRELLALVGWRPRELDAVVVSRGPGSYTGLRVGIMSAKTLAYASGSALLAVDTFAAIALQAPGEAPTVAVIDDAQQERLYAQRFWRSPSGDWESAAPLTILPRSEWLTQLEPGIWVSGPGVRDVEDRLPPNVRPVAEAARSPRPESLLQLGLVRLQRGERDDPLRVEPLYLRPSEAERKWEARRESSPSSC